jgi:hypothetical protein
MVIDWQVPALHSESPEQSWSSPAWQLARQRVPPTKRPLVNQTGQPGKSLFEFACGLPASLLIAQQTSLLPGHCEPSVQCHSCCVPALQAPSS